MTAGRQNISSGGPWEEVVGYSRAVRVGNQIHVAGTTASGTDGSVLGGDDPYAQATHALTIISRALHDAGGSMADVVRTRIFVTDMSHWEAIGRAHGEFFHDVRPVSTMVQVSALIDPRLLVEIEADAVLGGER